ncbi:hypothetical protein ABBQ38_014136 [Trebouxia sp. C0009 RCD-2024]
MPVLEDSCAEQTETPLQQYCLTGLKGLYYIPDYLDSTQQNCLLEDIRSSKSRWTQVSGRRLQSYGGTVHEKWGGLLQAPLPAWLKPLLTRLDRDLQLYQGPPNHVLLNAYEPGQGILAHEDGPVYFPAASIVSLGSSAVMHFRCKSNDGIEPQPCASVLLMPGSLLIFNQEAYSNCLHGIAEVTEDVLDNSILNLKQCGRKAGTHFPRGLRHSLTIRRVLKVKSLVKLPGQKH